MSAVQISGKFGYGTMSLTWTPTPPPTEKSVESLVYVTSHPEFGTKLINGGEFYGPDNSNLKLLKAFVDSLSDKDAKALTISIKGGIDPATLKPSGTRASVKKSVDNINSFIPTDPARRPKVLFELARVDANIPYEETIGYIAEFVKSGELDGISLSEVGIESIRKAIGVFPISAVELELSLLCQDLITNGILEELSEHQVPIIAYSPLCRGYLTDHTVAHADTFLTDIPEGDMRRHFSKFTPENYAKNIVLVKKLHEFAHNVKNTTLESLALSWILKISGSKNFHGIKQVTRILPIPSGSTKEKIEKNLGNVVELSDDDLAQIEKITKEYPVQGFRYYEGHNDFA